MDGNELDGARIVVEASHGGRDRDRRGPGSDECFSCGGRGHWYVAWLLSSYLNTHTHLSFPPFSLFLLPSLLSIRRARDCPSSRYILVCVLYVSCVEC